MKPLDLALSIKNLTKTYANGTKALSGITFDIKKGDFFALLWPNGAGKSTTIGVISGLVTKTSGQVVISGHDLDESGAEARMWVWVVPQEFNFGIFEKVYDIVIAQAGYYGISRKDAASNAEKYLKALGLWEKKDVQARTLSGGMKRRLMIARALIHDPTVLILDEPTAGVDLELRHGMYAFLREMNESGMTIILTTHYLEEAESLCRNMAIIDAGVIRKQWPIRELLATMEDEVVTIDLDKKYRWSLLEKYHPKIIDTSIDLTISSLCTLDNALQILREESYKVVSVKPKSGRLEEFFLKSTQK